MTDSAEIVTTSMKVFRIIDINDQTEDFTVDVALTMRWRDPTLANATSTLVVLDSTPALQEFKNGGLLVGVSRFGNAWRLEGSVKKRQEDIVLQLKGGKDLHLPRRCVLDEFQPDWEGHFFPTYTLTNQKDDVKTMSEIRVLETCDDFGGDVYYKHRFIGTFSERLELRRFPFDRQLLTIKMTSELFGERCRLEVANDAEWSNGDFKRDVAEVEWKLMQVENRAKRGDKNRKADRSTFKAIIAVERKTTYFMVNVVALLGLTTFTSLASEWITLDNYQDRLQCQASFLTGTLVWKFLINDWIPRKPYLTVTDIYILSAFTIQFICICLSWFQCDRNDEAAWLTLGPGYVFSIVWILFHMFILLVCFQPRLARLTWAEVYEANNQAVHFTDESHFSDDAGEHAVSKRRSERNQLQEPLLPSGA